MKVIYLSVAASSKTVERISHRRKYNYSGYTEPKFHRLITEGIVKNGVDVIALSTPYVSSSFYNSEKNDVENGVEYKYISTVEIPIIRHLCILLNVFFNLLYHKLRCHREEFIVVCDALNISLCLGALICRSFGVKTIGLVTDMPGLTYGANDSFISRKLVAIEKTIIKRHDGYIFLTEAMSDIINLKGKPYIVMEGLVDESQPIKRRNQTKTSRNIIYAGSLYKRYGVEMLIKAFYNVKGDNLRLTIYGQGPMAEDMPEYEKLDPRFKFMGLRPNEEIVDAELQATLLVNPRPTSNEFCKYSFPSKNMEYMASGTPVLTMALPGMTKDYYENLFVCYDETVEGLSRAISDVMNLTDDELDRMGERGKNFVLQYKNNRLQGKRIIELAKSIIHHNHVRI